VLNFKGSQYLKLLIAFFVKQEKENNTKDANNSSVQGELKLENENISPEIADISGQSKGEKRKAEEEELSFPAAGSIYPDVLNFKGSQYLKLLIAFFVKESFVVDGAVCKLLCKIFKEGYYIPWGEEQSLIFARKLGGELSTRI